MTSKQNQSVRSTILKILVSIQPITESNHMTAYSIDIEEYLKKKPIKILPPARARMHKEADDYDTPLAIEVDEEELKQLVYCGN